jgi:hypothetical protein
VDFLLALAGAFAVYLGKICRKGTDMGIRGEIFSTRSSSKSERRTYFFNVKENRNGDIFLNVVESKKHGEADFERHQIVVFQEDLSEFLQAMGKAVEAMKPHHARRSEGRFTSDESSSGE